MGGSTIPNSNIVDLVNDVMRKRKGFNPEHSSTFAKALTKTNVPEDYVRNRDQIDSIRWYRRLEDSQAPGHHLFHSQLKHPLKCHEEHPKAQQLPLLSMESG